jgi:hypothetical protein
VTSRAHGLLVDERLTEHARRDILRTLAIRKGADALSHRPREAKRVVSAASLREPTQTHQGRKTLGSNVLYQCNRDAVRDSRGNRGFRGLTIKTSTQSYD